MAPDNMQHHRLVMLGSHGVGKTTLATQVGVCEPDLKCRSLLSLNSRLLLPLRISKSCVWFCSGKPMYMTRLVYMVLH